MKRPASVIPTLSAALLLAAASSQAASPSPWEPLRAVAVQDGGRLKPLDTFAREAARKVGGPRAFGAETMKGLEPVEWVVAMLADPARWQSEPMVRVTDAALRAAVALPADRDRFSFRELVGHEPFLRFVEATLSKLDMDRGASHDGVEQEAQTLYGTLSLLSGIFAGEALHILPSARPEVPWTSVAELGTATGPRAVEARAELGGLVAAYARGDLDGVRASGAALRNTVASAEPAAYPSAGDLEREVRYNRAKPFRTAWVLYLAGFLLLLASVPLRGRAWTWLGLAAVAAGFAVNTWGLWLRTLVAGRAPVTNMYETVVFVAWGAMFFALALDAAYRTRTVSTCAAALGVIALVLADNVPILDGAIDPLVPVLRDNFWLTLHVLTIMLGYAAFLLALGIAHLSLGLFVFGPRRLELGKTVSRFLYRSLQVGTFFLAVGTLLGGVWASYAWGRFWGWDPKETWALIALLGYLAILHGRFAGWVKDFGLAVGAILGFLLVLMAWYGVNYILGTGLHSYGFGTGGYAWVTGFVAFELGFVAVATVRRPDVPAIAAPAPLADAIGPS
jgi:cytochrome c-type biogenesis protein CcsB